MNLDYFISNHRERWEAALAHAKIRRPWIRRVGEGLYRAARRPTDKDKAWRPHFVQFSIAGSTLHVSCDCEAYVFGNACYHIAKVYQHAVKRAQRAKRKAA